MRIIMKRMLLLCSFLTLLGSCTGDAVTEDSFHFEILPIATVELPNELVGDEMIAIDYTYLLPTNCHSFNDLYYIENGNERTIAVVNLVTDSTPTGLACTTLNEQLDERNFEFYVPPEYSVMVLRFWQGEDVNGEDIYLRVELPVVEE